MNATLRPVLGALALVTISALPALADAQPKKGEVPAPVAPPLKGGGGTAVGGGPVQLGAPGLAQGPRPKPQFRPLGDKERLFAAAGLPKAAQGNMDAPIVIDAATPMALQGAVALVTKWPEATDPIEGTIALSPGRFRYERGPTPRDGWFPDLAVSEAIVRVVPQPQRAYLVECAFEQRAGAEYSVAMFRGSAGAPSPTFVSDHERAQRVTSVVREGVATDIVFKLNSRGTPQVRNALQVMLAGCEITVLRQ